MKAYTDLEQSTMLTEFLPIESADMYYQYVLPKSDKIRYNPILGNPIDALEWYNKGYTHFGKSPLALNEYCIPCWSLAALLDLLDDVVINDEGVEYSLMIAKEEGMYYIHYHDRWEEVSDIETDCYYDLVDACCEMVLKLHELRML